MRDRPLVGTVLEHIGLPRPRLVGQHAPTVNVGCSLDLLTCFWAGSDGLLAAWRALGEVRTNSFRMICCRRQKTA